MTRTISVIYAPASVAITAVARMAARPAPAINPLITGRVVCASINCVTLCDEAPSAIRTPISLVRCSTRYDSTLNSPDTVSSSASAPRINDTQNATWRKNVSSRATVRIVMICPMFGSTLVR